MKLPRDVNSDILVDYNIKQDTVNRQESGEVKRCFTTQAHQTIIASTAILGIVLGLMGDDINYHLLVITTLLNIALCLTTINVGAHKFNTSNRALAYQIHLSRITDYEENSKGDEQLLATELRRIDWEEAMFAWRVIQPIIYNYFYGSKKRKYGNNSPAEVECAIEKYPWYDSRRLINANSVGKSDIVKGQFYPGTYLRKMFNKLYFVIGILLCIYSVSIWNILESSEANGILKILLIGIASLPMIYIIKSLVDNFYKCKKLESGIISIQSSAFVWRIVCLTMLLAKKKAIRNNRKIDKDYLQVYRGYTTCLTDIACEDLYFNLHRIHSWMEQSENKLIKDLSA